jgi:hypothetical protein
MYLFTLLDIWTFHIPIFKGIRQVLQFISVFEMDLKRLVLLAHCFPRRSFPLHRNSGGKSI